MTRQPTANFWRRLLLRLAASVAVFAAILPLTAATAQVPAAMALLNAPFREVATPGRVFDLVESVSDFDSGAKSLTFTTEAVDTLAIEYLSTVATPHYLSVLEGELTIVIDGRPAAIVAGKGVVAPGGSVVTIRNDSPGRARLFAATLIPVGGTANVHTSMSPGVEVFAVARRTMTDAPAVVDVVQMAAQYDVGYRTSDHVMNEFHLMIHLSGQVGYHYLDGGVETYGPGSQATMHEGRPGWMGNDGEQPSSMAWTWLGTPGRPLSSAVAASTQAPAPPRTGSGLSGVDSGPWNIPGLGIVALAVAATLAGVALLGTNRPAPRSRRDREAADRRGGSARPGGPDSSPPA